MLRLIHERTPLIEPILPSGFTGSGIYLRHHDNLPRVYARVIQAHECHGVRAGDLIAYRKYTEDEYRTRTYGKIFAIHEAYVLGVMSREDGSPWFKGEEDGHHVPA